MQRRRDEIPEAPDMFGDLDPTHAPLPTRPLGRPLPTPPAKPTGGEPRPTVGGIETPPPPPPHPPPQPGAPTAAPAPTAPRSPARAPRAFASYASVAVGEPVDQPYTYGVPDTLAADLRLGSIVTVPFGRRRTSGCVVGLSPTPPDDFDPAKIRAVAEVLTPDYSVDADIVDLALWMAEQTMSPPGEALSCASFLGFTDISAKTAITLALAPDAAERAAALKLTPRQKTAIECLAAAGAPMAPKAVTEACGAGAAVLKRLISDGIVERRIESRERADDYGPPPPPDTALALTADQASATAALAASVATAHHEVFLLHGVTGSGKTEVYLQAIAAALAAGGDAICLVPEISLTPQAVARFRSRFGDLVGVYHSRLTLGQKFDLWRRLESGRCRVMVGARSAVFAPMRNLRIIVVDEEHEASYKQDTSPRYHARRLALERARRAGAVAVLGSATPSVESYHRAREGVYHLLELPDRVDGRPLPTVRVVDMSTQLRDEANPSFFSVPLRAAIAAALDAHDMVLLFLNRRGFFNFLVCLECHGVVRCPHCDVSLTYHKPINKLMCHYCNRESAPPAACPTCGHEELTAVGLGTQRLEEEVRHAYPKARVVRLDLDTTRHRTAFIDAWRGIEKGEADIILGTQMIAKGIHLENVTVVGVPLADVSLFQPDFRSAERAFSLLTQVAGRAGRGERPGEVFIQTYVPHHYAVKFAQTHDYKGFFAKEIRVREVLRFPPFHELVSVLATGTDAARTSTLMREFARILRSRAFVSGGKMVVLGPAPAPLGKIDDRYRWRLLLRGPDLARMRAALRQALLAFASVPGKSAVQLTIDVDPQDLL